MLDGINEFIPFRPSSTGLPAPPGLCQVFFDNRYNASSTSSVVIAIADFRVR